MSSPSFKQDLVCVFGQPVAENPTQPMIESAFRAAGLDWRYLTIEVSPEGLGDAIKGLRAMGFRGANLTIPHKVAVIQHLDRTKERGETLVELLNSKSNVKSEFVLWESDYDIPEGTDVVINATSIGLFPDVDARLRMNTGTLTDSMIVADVIPNPPETRLIKEARDKGCKTLDGLGMLVNQGVIGFKLWTGIDPDPKVMRKALEDIFAG